MVPTTERRGGRLERVLRSAGTRPGRLRILMALTLLTTVVTFSSGTLAIVTAERGLETIGAEAGPQVVATADLYFALSDMDTQVASVLLMGNDHDLGIGRADAIERYEARRKQANRALVEATDLAGEDRIARDMIRAMLNGLGEYERLSSNAMLQSERADHAPGATPEPVLELYRQAYEVMKFELLPNAYNLTLENGTIVRHTEEQTSQQLGTLRMMFAIGGTALVVVLIGTQVYLSVRFRRTLNPALVLATAGVFVVTLAGVFVMTRTDTELATAKRDGFDSILAMSRTRAISNSMQADQSRYLLDADQADTYEQTFLEKSQTVLYKESANLDIYRNAVDLAVEAFGKEGNGGGTPFLGFFGDEVTSISVPGQRQALVSALQRYEVFQNADGEMRALADAGQERAAIGMRVNRSDEAFGAYDRATKDLIALHSEAFDQSIEHGRNAIAGWRFVLPVTAGVVVLLVLFGVRQRLAEYR